MRYCVKVKTCSATLILLLFIYVGSISSRNVQPLDFIYHDNVSLTEYLKRFNSTHSDIATLYSIGKSAKGKQLWVMKLSMSDPSEENVANIKLIGNIHGNEAVGREVLLHFIDYLGSNYKTDEKIKHLLKHNNVHILPSLNPDGFEASMMECATDVGRHNNKDVDLNRNFPDYFRNNGIPVQSETRAVMKWMNSTNFVLSASLHGGAMVANYPFDTVKEESSDLLNQESKTDDDDVFHDLALTYSKSHQTMFSSIKCNDKDPEFSDGIINGALWYSVTGSMGDYNYAFHDCMEITLEISCCKYPPANELENLWNQNKNALLEYSLKAGMGVKGTVVDETTKKPIVKAQLLIEGRNVIFYTKYNGEFFRILLPGFYRMKISAPNYKSVIEEFYVKNDSLPIMTSIRIHLIPGNDTKEVTFKTTTEENMDIYNTPITVTEETHTESQVDFIDNVKTMASTSKMSKSGALRERSSEILVICVVLMLYKL